MKSKSHQIAIRTAIGIAIPYGNSIDIPFEKGFYGGGANGMRAWPLRYLGPGAYQNINPEIERVGDFQLEANAEYRFSIYKVFKGALFYDIGNIWYLSENETFPGGQLSIQEFPGELAMDIGIGLRLDFSYFIFRIDVAQRMKDPAYPQGERWVIGKYNNWFNPVFNLGIGYPF
jgi:outer membrane protein assembly factor BamA